MNKKILIFNLIFLLMICLNLNAADFKFKYPLSTVDMKLQKVSEHVYFVQGATGIATYNQGFISNATVVIGSKGITIIDGLGSPSLAEQLLSLVRKVSDLPVIRVITTHYHADHIYGLQVFEDLGAKIYAPFGVDEYLNSKGAADRIEERRFSLDPWVNDNTRLVFPDVLIEESFEINDGDVQLTVNYLGRAHSDADLTVLVEPDQVFITGDVIFEGRIPFVGDSDSKAWLETLNEMAEKKGIKALIPGHGRLARDPLQAIKLTRDYLAYLRLHLGDGVEEMMSFDELYSSIDWSPFEKLPAFKLGNRINAYQVFLALEKELLDN
ncbi:MAG: MBL fold metallo-hydrolase [Gammaproteobacteria bacterium]|nr:MBL fold metallo-hydrolase [Gammaproteobacteria bacterium]